uniref:Uncharacterized protein n=1 Tax=Trypanosoma congolense (strain IL3000) TaxID=1068625 RepID=G0UZ72_TRYCI|nr:hypothetical protein, unlikely [Trypanosoma congolense IL3000]
MKSITIIITLDQCAQLLAHNVEHSRGIVETGTTGRFEQSSSHDTTLTDFLKGKSIVHSPVLVNIESFHTKLHLQSIRHAKGSKRTCKNVTTHQRESGSPT